MIKKDKEIKWNEENLKAFQIIKQVIVDTSILIIPDHSNTFNLFSYSSKDIIVTILS